MVEVQMTVHNERDVIDRGIGGCERAGQRASAWSVAGIDRGTLPDPGVEEYDTLRMDDDISETRQHVRRLVGVRCTWHDDVPEVDAANGDLAHPASLPHRSGTTSATVALLRRPSGVDLVEVPVPIPAAAATRPLPHQGVLGRPRLAAEEPRARGCTGQAPAVRMMAQA